MSARFRILMSTSVFPRNETDATPAFVKNLAEDLASSGHAVTVIAPHSKGCAVEEVSNGVRIVRHRYAWPSSLQTLCYEGGMLVRLKANRLNSLLLPTFALSQLCLLRKEIKTTKPDLIHAHSLLPQGWIAAKGKQRIPLAISSHGNDVFGLKNKYTAWKQFTAKKADALIANSKATASELATFSDPSKIHVIPASPNFLDESHANPQELRSRWGLADQPTIGFAGRLIPEKGCDKLIERFSEIRIAIPDAKLLIFGEGPSKNKLLELSSGMGLESSVRFMGWINRKNIVHHLSACDVIAIPSQPQASGWSEAQGLVAVEAMAAGRPIACSNIGGLKESVINGKTGFLIDPDDYQKWTEILTKILLASNEQRASWGEAGRQRFHEKYSREALCFKTIDLYKTLTSTT